MPYYHVHMTVDPYCVSWDHEKSSSHEVTAYAQGVGGKMLSGLPFPAKDCPYLLQSLEEQVSTGYRVVRQGVPGPQLGADIQESIDEALATLCPTCGETLGDHEHPTKGGGERVVTVTSRSTGPRKKPEERAPCPFCGGPMHFNDAGAKTNFECLYRQFLVASGTITDPLKERLPVATHLDIANLGTWIGKLVIARHDLTYGKMESGAGAATFSQLRRKAAPTTILAPKPEPHTVTIDNKFREAEEIAVLVPVPEEVKVHEETEEEAAERKLEETRKKDRERKAARRALLRNAVK